VVVEMSVEFVEDCRYGEGCEFVFMCGIEFVNCFH